MQLICYMMSTLFVLCMYILTLSCLLIAGASQVCCALTCICIHGRIRDGPWFSWLVRYLSEAVLCMWVCLVCLRITQVICLLYRELNPTCRSLVIGSFICGSAFSRQQASGLLMEFVCITSQVRIVASEAQDDATPPWFDGNPNAKACQCRREVNPLTGLACRC